MRREEEERDGSHEGEEGEKDTSNDEGEREKMARGRRKKMGHQTPVIAMCNMRDADSGSSLLTFSVDGVVCKWAPDDLTTQLDSFRLMVSVIGVL